MPSFRGDRTPGWVFGLGLVIYDLLALKWGHRHYDARGLLDLCPVLASQGLLGGYRFIDATTDDARLALRVLREAVRGGSLALNYARVESLLTRRTGQVCGVVVRDQAPGADRTAEIRAPVVISATGAGPMIAHAGRGRQRCALRKPPDLPSRACRSPAVSVHPATGRPAFAVPWEGVTLIGTTDVDHADDLAREPAIDSSEASFLLAMATFAFPSLELGMQDVMATQAGVRAVINTGRSDPSKESREYVLWDERGLLTVTGGKLTTFRRMAHSALRA
jgi:glycerol-3-phosphate dehydrogenase